MATSESDDFESADEEMDRRGDISVKKNVSQPYYTRGTIGSDSDDDADFIPNPPINQNYTNRLKRTNPKMTDGISKDQLIDSSKTLEKIASSLEKTETKTVNEISQERPSESKIAKSETKDIEQDSLKLSSIKTEIEQSESKQCTARKQNVKIAKKLGSRIVKDIVDETKLNKDVNEITTKVLKEFEEEKSAEKFEYVKNVEEVDMPEELKSDKKFSEVFDDKGWEGLDDDIKLPDNVTEKKIEPVLNELVAASKDTAESSGGSWGSWGMWGMNSLIESATAGVSTLTSHVSQGLTLLEESVGVPNPTELAELQKESPMEDQPKTDLEEKKENQYSFGFGNILSGVSSITKIVEETGSMVMSGGLDTLEAIGKKTMEVLQEGDPGLKKKRAFFLNESDKPILSQVLREAKEKADSAEKSIEEKKAARKVHFESLFDDYQGLVHLEALEMLSKQSNIKIQQHMSTLDDSELIAIQETLEEVKELCDFGEEEEEEEEKNKNLRERLNVSCKDLGISINYDKLCDISEDAVSFLASEHSSQEVYQKAICTLAQFTAISVERFHKTAELILIKERRSTVSEADSLVQLVQILSNYIGTLANSFCQILNEQIKSSDTPAVVNGNITTIFLEAANASSYIIDAFKLLIPILQVGAL